ncbi:ATP-binding protein [Fibrella aquatica]|uniref:ATP-binding protein n=1 Tax=Fibrella aquatica TaxID=3242487 RepID=UPI003521FAC2
MKTIFIASIFACLVVSAIAQNKTYRSFRDYYVVNMNPDSLEKEIYARKRDQAQYMHNLIWLEYSRFTISDRFGDDLEEVNRLTRQQKSGLARAMYNYIVGLRYKNEDLPKSHLHFRDALMYFESVQDTAGMAHCHFALMRLNITNLDEQVGSMSDAKIHYDKVVNLIAQSSDDRDKISLIPGYLSYENQFYKGRPFAEITAAYGGILQLIKKHPEMKFILKNLYLNLGFLYNERKEFKKAVTNYELCLTNSSHCSEYNLIGIYTNLAAVYNNLDDNVKAEIYLKKILAANNPKNHVNDYLMIEVNFSMVMNNIKLKKFDGTIPYLVTYDSLRIAYTEHLKARELLNLQTKYETEKKEATIRILELEKERIGYRNRLMMSGLFVALLVSGVIGVLAFRLRRTNAELRSLQQSRDKLYTVIAHDLRAPINNMMSVGTLLKHLILQNKSEEIEEVTNQINLMGQHTSLLLNNLLEWGKTNYFEQSSTAQQIDATPLLQELTQVYKVLAEANGITMTVSLPASFPLLVNPKDLSLIVRNLLDNALKHTPSGGSVALTATTVPLANTMQAIIQVRDNGKGIAPDQLTYLQQVFAGRLKPQVGTHGLGLGMVLITDFARKNGATLRLSSQQGQGTVFEIILA